MVRPRIVTLTTDIGASYAAQMKAALLERLPPGHIVDIAHDLPAHRIEEAAFLLEHIGPAFPPGTVHVAVVDPGVGGARASVAIECRNGSWLVGPDNGVLAPLAHRLGVRRAIRLDPARVRPGRRVSPTFEGRDLFAPAAARLATGARPEQLGRPTEVRSDPLPQPARLGGWIRGTVLHIDRFGNAVSNVPSEWWPESGRLGTLRIRRRSLRLPRRRTYADLRASALGVLGSSFGTLEIAARESSAAARLRLHVGMPLALRPPSGVP